MPKSYELTVQPRRHRTLPNAGSQTLFCTVIYDGTGPAMAFLRPGTFPEFEGEEGWFVGLQHSHKRSRLSVRSRANGVGV